MSKNLLDYVGLGYFLEKIKTLFVTGLGTSGNNLTWTKNGTTNNITIPYATQAGALAVLQSKTYTNVIGTANNNPGAVFYFLSVKPTDWNFPCVVTYRISARISGVVSGTAVSILRVAFTRNTMTAYGVWNYIGNTSYRPYYYHYRFLATETGFNGGYGHLLGIGLQSSYNPTTAANARTFDVEVLEISNGTFTLFDTMTKYANVSGTGSTNYSGESTLNATTQGDSHSGDANTTNQLYSTGYVGPVGSIGILSTSLFMQTGAGHWSPFTTNTTGTTSTKNKNTEGFLLGSPILYFSGTNNEAYAVNVNSTVYLSVALDLRYSTNCGTTLILHRPVYLVGSIGNDGLFYLDDTWWTQTLPSSEDGKLYIHLGQTYASYAIQLWPTHPIYYFKDGKIRQYLVEQETDPIFSASPAAGITGANITAWNGKQDAISDLATIRSGASAGATAYQKPSGGIPKTDLSSAVQTSLGKADTALQSHQDISGKVDKVTSTDNAVVRFDGTSGAVQNSGVTINDSNQVTAAKFITSGGTNSQFVKGNGNLASGVNMEEVVWVGNSHTGLQPLENLYNSSGANVFAFLNTNYVSAEYTNDGGATWIDYDLTPSQKTNLFTLDGTVYVGKRLDSTVEKTANDAVRVTVSVGCGVYVLCRFLVVRVWAAGGCSLRVEYTTYADPTTFVEHTALSNLGDNPGYVVIPFSRYLFGNNDVHDLRFTYSYDGGGVYPKSHKSFGYIRAYSNNIYSTNSEYAKTGHLYAISSSQNARFPNDLQAERFIKTGGTSSQFLKADGSIDSIAYGTYSKPSGGIPASDLASAVQTSLGKADTALQSFTETDPTVPSWAKQSSKPTYTAQEVGALPASTSIPSKTSDLTNDSGFLTQHQDISGKENTSNKVTSLSSSSTDTQYPSAKCVYDLLANVSNYVFIEGQNI